MSGTTESSHHLFLAYAIMHDTTQRLVFVKDWKTSIHQSRHHWSQRSDQNVQTFHQHFFGIFPLLPLSVSSGNKEKKKISFRVFLVGMLTRTCLFSSSLGCGGASVFQSHINSPWYAVITQLMSFVLSSKCLAFNLVTIFSFHLLVTYGPVRIVRLFSNTVVRFQTSQLHLLLRHTLGRFLQKTIHVIRFCLVIPMLIYENDRSMLRF